MRERGTCQIVMLRPAHKGDNSHQAEQCCQLQSDAAQVRQICSQSVRHSGSQMQAHLSRGRASARSSSRREGPKRAGRQCTTEGMQLARCSSSCVMKNKHTVDILHVHYQCPCFNMNATAMTPLCDITGAAAPVCGTGHVYGGCACSITGPPHDAAVSLIYSFCHTNTVHIQPYSTW